MDNDNQDPSEPVEEDVSSIMESQGVDRDDAEGIRDLMDELGVDEDDAAIIHEAM
jgi:hypothetical protein